MHQIFCKDSVIVCSILFIRIAGVLLTKTSFVPDEYWQSLEVAHKMSFGYGHLTWEWKKEIRSCIYPLIFQGLYSIFPDSMITIVILPKLFQALLSSIGDFCTYKLSAKLFGTKCGKWTLFNILSSWFLFYCSSRTLTNMAETSFTACGFYLYTWKKTSNRGLTYTYMWFAGISVLMRPTAVVVWVPLYAYHIWREKSLYCIIKNTAYIGFTVFAVLLVCDRWCFGHWVVTPINFFLFNWTNDIGSFYGQHNLLWYFYAGLPVVLGIHSVPFLLGWKLIQLRPFYLLILWFLFIFSLLSHKEFRFLLPILPVALIICSVSMNEIASGRMTIFTYKINKSIKVFLVSLILLVNIPFSIYVAHFHQRGTIDAALFLSNAVSPNSSVLFLMPCHSTPYYSYVHQNITMKILSCEPNFDGKINYKEEAEEFYENPNLWLSSNFISDTSKLLPSHIVMFETLYNHIAVFLKTFNYQLCYKTFHSHLTEQRTGKFVHIYCKD